MAEEWQAPDDWTRRLIELLLRIAAAAREHGKPYFIGGGLAVDLTFGGLSRPHEDIDLHPLEADSDWWRAWFGAQGHIVRRDADMAEFPFAFFVTTEADEYVADVYPVTVDAAGVIAVTHTEPYHGRPWWEGKYWHAIRTITIAGERIAIEDYRSALAQKAGHVRWHGGTLTAKHLHDFRRAGMRPEDI